MKGVHESRRLPAQADARRNGTGHRKQNLPPDLDPRGQQPRPFAPLQRRRTGAGGRSGRRSSAKSGGKRRRKKRTKLSAEAKLALRIKRDHFREIRSIFSSTGFTRVPSASDKQFTYRGTTSDFDDVFIYENVIVIAECTTLKEKISDHLKKKKVLYDKIKADPSSFIEFLDRTFPQFRTARGAKFRPEYIDFCAREINLFIAAVKDGIPSEKWTADKKVKDRILTTTNINGFINCLRQIVDHKKTYSLQYYKGKLKDVESFPFTDYRSSQYVRMGEDMYKKYFAK
jgi:hypothetical protein